MSVKNLCEFMEKIELTEHQHFIGDQILKEIRARVGFLKEVGLEYLTLTRATGTLSGGEQQRVALARLMIKKCELILADEPTGSLDPENTRMVMNILKNINKEGKTIIIVTHNEEIVRDAEYKIEL